MRKALVALAVLSLVAGFAMAQESKVDDPSTGSVLNRATGGPDAYGYTFSDQAEPDCSFGFFDISATGALVVSGDDSAAPWALGGPGFDYYGTVQTMMAAATNGYLTTDLADTGPDLSNDCPLPAVPSTPGGTPGGRLYPVHDDLVTDVYHQYFIPCPVVGRFAAAGCNIFQWEGEHFGGPADSESFQAVLYDNGDWTTQINAAGEAGSGSTTGMQDYAPPTTGLTYACNAAASAPAGTAVCFFSPTAVPVDLQTFDID